MSYETFARMATVMPQGTPYGPVPPWSEGVKLSADAVEAGGDVLREEALGELAMKFDMSGERVVITQRKEAPEPVALTEADTRVTLQAWTQGIVSDQTIKRIFGIDTPMEPPFSCSRANPTNLWVTRNGVPVEFRWSLPEAAGKQHWWLEAPGPYGLINALCNYRTLDTRWAYTVGREVLRRYNQQVFEGGFVDNLNAALERGDFRVAEQYATNAFMSETMQRLARCAIGPGEARNRLVGWEAVRAIVANGSLIKGLALGVIRKEVPLQVLARSFLLENVPVEGNL